MKSKDGFVQAYNAQIAIDSAAQRQHRRPQMGVMQDLGHILLGHCLFRERQASMNLASSTASMPSARRQAPEMMAYWVVRRQRQSRRLECCPETPSALLGHRG
jgi:hypothetical protein